MPVEITMPKLGLTMTAGTISRWMKAPGDAVAAGEPLLEVATEKINYEIESPATGTLGPTVGTDGDEFACGTRLGTIALEGETLALPAPDARASDGPTTVGFGPRVSGAAGARRSSARVLASPAARRLARERDVPLDGLTGTGPRDRITLSDIHGYRRAAPQAAPAHTSPPARLEPKRRAIFRKMTEVALLPLASVSTDVRVDAVRALIARRGDFGWTACAVYAVARLLRDHPELRTDASTGAPFERIDIGVAADTPHGLIVPVVRAADVASLASIHAEILRLGAAARDGTSQPGDLGGACFSISNVGPQGVERVTPLVDPPQTAILGIGAATERAVVVDGAIAPGWVMSCVLSFDHRFVDGAPAARFLAALARALTEPAMLL